MCLMCGLCGWDSFVVLVGIGFGLVKLEGLLFMGFRFVCLRFFSFLVFLEKRGYGGVCLICLLFFCFG